MRRWFLVSAVALACSKPPAPESGGTSPGGAAPEAKAGVTGAATAAPSAASALTARAAHLAAIDAAPSSAAVIGTVDVSWLMDSITAGGLLPSTRAPAAFRKTLGEASRKDFGIDLLATRSISFWVDPSKQAFAVVLHGPFDGALAIAGLQAKETGGRKVLILNGLGLALVGTDLVAGNREAFELLGNAPKDDGLRAKHKDLLTAAPDGAVQLTAVVPPELAQMMVVKGVDGAALSVADSLAMTLAIRGQKGALDEVSGLIDGFRTTVIGEVKNAVEQLAAQAFPGSALLTALAQATLEDLEAFKWTSRPSPDVLVGATPAIRLPQAAALIVPTLAAIAVPAFVKYTDRAKTVEAVDNLDRLYKGMAVFYSTPRVGPDGAMLPCSFPPSTEITPPLADCCNGTRGADGVCTPSATDWTGSWAALGFSLSDPHRFHYKVTTSGEGATAKFTVSAYADLDCDGVYSTFERYGEGDPEAKAGECSMQGSRLFFKEQETE